MDNAPMKPNNGLIFKVLKLAPKAAGLAATDKALLLQLLDHWNPNRFGAICFPGYRRLADRIGVSYKSVQRSIARLEALELIKTIRRYNDSNETQLNIIAITELIETGQRVQSGEGRPVRLTSQTGQIDQSDRSQSPINALDRLNTPLRRSTVTAPKQNELRLLSNILENALQGKGK